MQIHPYFNPNLASVNTFQPAYGIGLKFSLK